MLIDLAGGRRRLGGSALAQVYGQLGNEAPDLDDPQRLAAFFALVQRLRAEDSLLAYHDVGDGGLFVTLCEMAFASRCGLDLDARRTRRPTRSAILFAEELGAVVQVRRRRSSTRCIVAATAAGLAATRRRHARRAATRIRIACGERDQCSTSRASTCTAHGRRPRMRCSACATTPDAADEEYARLLDARRPGTRRRV